MRPLYTKFSLVFLFSLLSLSNSPIAKMSSVDRDLTTKDKTKEITNPTKPRNEVGGKNDRPKKDETFPSPTKKKAKVLQIPPTILNEDIKTSSFTPLAILSKGLQPIKTNFNKETNYNKIVGPDPFRFIITSNKDSVAVGEEIELTIAVDWVDFGINNGVRFLPEWYKYTLRVVTPKGFTQTGGDYTDFCTKPVDANNPQAVFTIKGKFEYQPEEAKFTVLRGFEGADERSDFIWKENFEVRIRNSIINPRNKNSRIANACEDNNSLIKDEITGTAGWTLPPSANNWTHFRSPDTWLSGGDVIWRTKITTVPTSSNGGKVAGFYGLAYPTTPASIEEMETKSEFTFEKGKAYYIRFEQAKFDYSGTGEAIGNGKIFVRINGVDYKSNNNATTNFQPVIIGPIYFTNDTKSKIRTGVLLEPGHFNATYILLDDLVVFSVSKPQISASPTSISSGNKSTITLTGCPSTATVSWTNYASTGNPIDVYPTTTTTYKAQCTEANGCVGDWSNEVTVTVTTPPCAATKPSITGSTTGCSSVKLSINKVTGETYTWYEGTTNKGAGTDSPDGTKVEFPASTIGLKSYTVKASVTGCSATSNAKDVTITSTPAAPSVVQEDHSTTQFKLTVSGCDGGSLSWDDDIGSGNPIYVVKNVTATYKVKCTVGTCVSGWSNEIVVTNTPACTLIKPGRTKTDNTCSVTLTASSDASNGVVEYQWQKENGTYGDISGQTASTLTLTETGNYRVVISKAGCTSGTSDPYNVSTIPSVAKPAASDVSYDVGQSPSALTATTINADYTLTWWGESSTGGTPSTSAPTPSTAVAGTIYYYVSQYKTNTTACESPRTKITVNVTDPVCNVAKPTNTSVTPDKITSGQNPSIALGGDCTGSSTLYWKKSGTTDAWSSAGSTNVSVATTFDFRCQEGTCNSLNGESKSVSLNGGVTFKTITPSNTSDCASADGSVIALAEGGKGSGYSYKLLKSDGVTVERTYQSSGTFTGLRSGTYYVQAKDGDDTESAVSSVSILSPSAPGKPTFSPASATINDGDSYNITTPTCSSSSPEWKTTFVNPVKISGYFKAICIDGECSSAESTFTLTVNGKTITIDETTSPNCFNRGGTIKVTVSGTGAFTYALYDVNAGSFITGKNAYAGTTHTFTGLSEGKYKVYVTPDGTAPTINSEEVTLTKDCSGGYTITDVVSPGCFGKNGSFKVTVSNPTAGIGYLYTLIDATNPDPSRGILSTKNGGSTYTFTGLTKGLYRVDITEDRANGGVIWGDTRADLTTLGCISGGLVIDQNSRVKANCIGLGGGFTVSIESPTAGIGYVYTLINTATGQSVIGHINVYDGSSHTFTGLAFGTYRVDVQEDIPGNAGGIINGNQTVTIEKDCSDFAVTISELIPVNCTNTGDGKIRITGLPSLSIPAVGMYRYTLFESYISPFRDPVNIYPVAQTPLMPTWNTTFPVIDPSNAWKVINANTWEVTLIKNHLVAGSPLIPIPSGTYYATVSYDYYSPSNGTQQTTGNVTPNLRLENDLIATANSTGSVCGRNDGKIKVNMTCGVGKYALALYRNDDENYVRLAGETPTNRITANNYTFNNLAPGRYYVIVTEIGFDNYAIKQKVQVNDIIVSQLPIPINISSFDINSIPKTAFCQGETVKFTANPPTGSTYAWVGVPASQVTLATPTFVLPTLPGNYTYGLKTTTGLCASADETITVTVRTPPEITFTNNSPDDGIGTIETGEELRVSVIHPVSSPRTYEWKYSETDPTAGTGVILSPTVSPFNEYKKANAIVADNGYYKVKVTDEFGCVSTDNTKVKIKNWVCAIAVTSKSDCYLDGSTRYAHLDLTVTDRTKNWPARITVTRIKDGSGTILTGQTPILVQILPAIPPTATSTSTVIPQLSNVLDGTYKVELIEKRSDEDEINICQKEYEVVVLCKEMSCDIAIKAKDPITNVESNKFERLVGTTNQYKPLKLTVENLSGLPFENATYTWTGPDGAIADPTTATQTVNKVGEYKVVISNGVNTCDAYITLSGKPCITLPNEGVCGTPPSLVVTENCTAGPFLPNLAVGDKFSAADYYVEVTEITGGDPTSGWTGKGKVEFFRVLDALRLTLEVEFTDAKIDDCYQFVCGKVISTYDPTWKNFIDWAEITAGVRKMIDLGKDIIDKDPTDPENQKAFYKFVEDAKKEFDSMPWTQAEYDDAIAKLNASKDAYDQYVACHFDGTGSIVAPTSKLKSARMSATSVCPKSPVTTPLNEIKYRSLSSITCISEELFKNKFPNKTFLFYSDGSPVKLKDNVQVVAFVNDRVRASDVDKIGRLYALKSNNIVYVPCADRKTYVQNGEICNTSKIYVSEKNIGSTDLPQKVIITTTSATVDVGTANVYLNNTSPPSTPVQTFSVPDGCICKLFADGDAYGEFGNAVIQTFVGDPNNKLTAAEIAKLELLFSGTAGNGSDLKYSMKLILTDNLTPQDKRDYIAKYIKETPKIHVLWLDKQSGVWVFKEESTLFIPKNAAEVSALGKSARLGNDYNVKDLFKKIGQRFHGNNLGVAALAEGIYWLSDKVSQGIKFFKIPDRVWDYNSADYNANASIAFAVFTAPITAQDYFISRASTYLSTNASKPATGTQNSSIKGMLDAIIPASKDFIDILTSEPTKLRFALVCGMWNGLLDIPEGLSAAISTIAGVYKSGDDNTFTKLGSTIDNLSKYRSLSPDGVYSEGIGAAFYDGIAYQVSTPVKVAYMVGSIVPSIAITILTAGTGSVTLLSRVGPASKNFMKAANLLNRIDNYTDVLTPLTYVFKFTGYGISRTYRLFYGSASEVVGEVVERLGKDILTGVDPSGNPISVAVEDLDKTYANGPSTQSFIELRNKNDGTLYKFARKVLSNLNGLINSIVDSKSKLFLTKIIKDLDVNTTNKITYRGQSLFEVTSDGKLKSLVTSVNESDELIDYNTDGKILAGSSTETQGFGISKKADNTFTCTGGFCFPAGTPITIKQNNHKTLKNIENIVAGDVVGGYDHILKKFAWGVVKATKKSIKRGLVSLFAAGTLIAQPTLEHPVWTENHHDYVPAQDLKVGDTFLDGKGATLRLDSLAIKPDTTLTVYNFEVNDLHNYYVGTQEVLVHNTCATLENLAGKLSPPLSVDAAQTLIRDFENSFVRSGIPRLDRTNFYEQILDNLNKNKLSTADVNTLLSEFNSSAISADIKKYLTKNASKGSFDAWLTIKTWTHKSDVYDLLRSGKLNLRGNSYSVKKVGNDLEIYHQDGSKIATISKTEITATSTNGSGNITDMNQVLNVYPHLKNYTIKVDNDRFIYKTDNQGRVKSFTDSDYQLVANKPRSGEQQIAKDIKNGNTGTPPDDGGHMSSTESGGLCEQLNYYPMNPLINRSGGLWRENVERVLKAARQNPANAGKKIEYTVIPTFSSVHIGRPDILNVIWKVDGISQTPISVPNPY